MNPNDWTIHQLTIMREAVLSILDEGRLLPDGTRAPWGFYPNSEAAQALESLLNLMDDGDLVRDTTKDDDVTFFTYQAMRITRAVVAARDAIDKAADWHMDESGDVNEQRTQFCDEVQSYVMKEAQKANVEIIDHKARAF